MDLFASQTAHAFGERNKEPNAGGSAVKDDRRGGHRPAQTKALRSAEGWEGAAKGAWASSLTARGSTPKHLEKQQHREVAESGVSRQRQWAAGAFRVGLATAAIAEPESTRSTFRRGAPYQSYPEEFHWKHMAKRASKRIWPESRTVFQR